MPTGQGLPIEEIVSVKFKTSDGTEHHDKDAAIIHEAKLEVFNTLLAEVDTFEPLVAANGEVVRRVIFGMLTDHKVVRQAFVKYQKRIVMTEKRIAKTASEERDKAA